MLEKLQYYWSKILKKARMKAITGSKVDPKAHIAAGCHIYKSEIGKYTAIGYDCQIIHCKIGSFCSFASGIIIGGAEHPMEWVSTSQVFVDEKDSISKKFCPHKFGTYKETTIGNDVWIGDRVLIKAGVNVSDGAVIGMGSVVTKNIGPYEIWAGNPAKMIKKRFDDHMIENLLKFNWYELDDQSLDKLANYIDEPAVFIKKYKEMNENK